MASRLVISLIFLGIGFSYNAKYGFELYQDGKNARNAALGGLSVSYTDGCNPVFLKDIITPSIHFSHKNKFGGNARVTILSYLHTKKKYPHYLSLTNRSVENIPNTSSACDPVTLDCNYSAIDDFSQQEIGIKFSTIRLFGQYTLGFTIKPSFSSLAESKSYGISVDIAAMLQALDKLDVTLRLEDMIGIKYWDTGTTETISPLVIGGIYYQFTRLRVGLERGSRIESHTLQHFHVGFEYQQKEQLFLRVGTSHLNQFTAGIGIRLPLIDFDYAYLHPGDNSLPEASHIISVGINLGSIHKIKGKITP